MSHQLIPLRSIESLLFIFEKKDNRNQWLKRMHAQGWCARTTNQTHKLCHPSG